MERMRALLDLAKSKKNVLEIAEINNFFKDIDLTEERIEKIIEFLEQKNVDVLQISEDKDTDDDMNWRIMGKFRTMMRSRISICLCRMVSVLRIRYVCI